MKVLSVRYSEEKTRLSKHYHDAHQLLYVSKGSVSILCGNRSISIGEGTLVLFHRFDEHSLRVLSAQYCRYSILVSPQDISETEEEALLSSVFLCRADHAPQTVFLGKEKEAFDKCCEELDLSMSHIMRKLIRDFIANNAKEEVAG